MCAHGDQLAGVSFLPALDFTGGTVNQSPPHFLVRAQNTANKKVAKKKVTEMYHSSIRERLESWFALGTHSRRPFSKWMIAGLLWMEKQFDTIFSKVKQKAYLGSGTSH